MNNIWQKGELRKQVKAVENRRTEVPGIEHTWHSQTTKNRPSQAGRHVVRPCHMARCGRAMWHGRFRLPNLLGVCQYFGTVASCLGAWPCHSRSASRLQFAFGVILGHT